MAAHSWYIKSHDSKAPIPGLFSLTLSGGAHKCLKILPKMLGCFRNADPTFMNHIKNELAAMAAADQAARRAFYLRGAAWDPTLDVHNTERMKEIIAQIGWPTLSNWGVEAANDARILVQHADHDPDFQRHCLELMKCLPPEEVQIHNFVYLADRVCINEGRPQLYGTQVRLNADGRYEAYNLDDPELVKERREMVGLEPL